MPRRIKRDHALATASVVLGVLTLAAAGVALYWDHHRDKHNGVPPILGPDPRDRARAAMPPAQAVAVPPPTLAQIREVQVWLNVIAGKKKGERGYLNPDGQLGPKTNEAIAAFQKTRSMSPTGKLDGMTRSAIANEAAFAAQGKVAPGGRAEFAFRLVYKTAPHRTWAVEDSMRFVTEIPGYTDRNHPPSDREVAKLLTNHYGAYSAQGKALSAGRYEFSCPDCP